MPLFGKKKGDASKLGGTKAKKEISNGNGLSGFPPGKGRKSSSSSASYPASATPSGDSPTSTPSDLADQHTQKTADMAQTKPKLIFHCQQAHGSPTACISGFTSVKELYSAIGSAFDMEPSDILFCTLNTHKVDMNRLLGGQIGLDDFIFAHVKGRPKEVEVMKSEDALGLTITDNGAGYPFIKRVKDNSTMSKIEGIYVGDHIEKLNGVSTVGMRHYEVAKMLKELPRGMPFLLRVVEPMKSGFANIGGANRAGKKAGSVSNGKETLRLRSKGPASIEVPSDVVDVVIDKINARLESYLGINDNELAQTIWEIGSKMKNSVEFAEELQKTELAVFCFSDEFLFEIWGDIGDAKSGRMVKIAQFDEKF